MIPLWFDVILAKSSRGLGLVHRQLGRYLMDTVISLPEMRTVKHIELYCLPELQSFYKQWGFTAALNGVITLRRLHL